MKTKIKPIEEIIKTFKNYYVNSDITAEHFPIPDTIQTENWELVHFDKTVTTQEVKDEMKKRGLRPANIYELAEWAKNETNLPSLKKYYIVAMGQEWKDSVGYHRVSYLNAVSDGDFHWRLGVLVKVWHDYSAFFGFRDLSQTSDTKTLGEDSDTLSLESRLAKVEQFLSDNFKRYK